MPAVHSGLTFIQPVGGANNGCGCGCKGGGPSIVFRSVWDRLVQQMFGVTPPGMDSEGQVPDVDVWEQGVVLQNDTDPYTFAVITDEEDAPVAGDVISYKGKYYIIGAVE